MKYSTNAINIITAQTFKGIGKAWIVKNLKGNEPVGSIVEMLNTDSKEVEVTLEKFTERRGLIEYEISKLEGHIDGIIALGDNLFPSCRGEIKNSERPVVIFYRGDLNLLNSKNKNIAVIGLLTPDIQIEIIEQEVVTELVKNGATIISGLALGCDSIAHRQALRSNGKTVAILPSPLNSILPTKNKALADEIVNHSGLLITEYYKAAKSKMELSSRYQERDRLQALFSDCVILSASYSKADVGMDSGSRLAMEYALKYSIPRAVIYDASSDTDNNPMYNLNRQLIREEKGITTINRHNLISSITKIISDRKKCPPTLFDSL